MHSALRATLLLQRLPELGPATYWRLLDTFTSPDTVLAQSPDVLQSILKPRTCEALAHYHRDPVGSPLAQQLDRDIQWLADHPEVAVLCFDDENYPELLRQIRKPPPLLYLRGNLDCLNLPQIAIVGSRSPTAGGSENAKRFASYLAGVGFAITSGLALGVDGAAHWGALSAKGKTIAVLGTGIDRIYPARHRSLAQQIIDGGGALVSEFPLGTSSQASNFPQRNRIISGLSCGTLIVEAALQSGSLITAKLALEQNREVFAIPGSIHNPLARGCHHLIREGAKLVETGEDILEELGGLLAFKREEVKEFSKTQDFASPSPQTFNPAELKLLDALGFDPVTIDVLAERSGLAVGAIAANLLGLELKGMVSDSPGGYIRVR